MEGDRPPATAVLRDVLEVEPVGQHELVDLNGRRLPFTTERVLYLDVDLRPVERAVARLDAVAQPRLIERAAHDGFGLLPDLGLAERLLGTCAESQRRLE